MFWSFFLKNKRRINTLVFRYVLKRLLKEYRKDKCNFKLMFIVWSISHATVWFSSEFIFPGLDVLRVAIRNQKVCDHVCSQPGFLERQVLFLAPSSPVPTQLLALRILANCFKHASGQRLLLAERETVITEALNCRLTPNKNVQVALATLLLNYSVCLQDMVDEEAGYSQCLLAVASVMENPLDPEAEFRLLVCLGTLICNDKSTRELAKSLELQNLIIPMQTRVEPKKVSECAGFVINRLQ